MSRPADRAPLTTLTHWAFVTVASLSALVAAAAAHGQASAAPPSRMSSEAWPPPYPAPALPVGFEGWTWVKSGPSGALGGQPAGTHHIYANPLAMEGFRTGQWADGAVLVFDVLEPDAASGPATDPARRLRTDVMVRDSARYGASGGWGYGEWLFAAAADGGTGARVNAPVAADPVKVCHACHERLAADRGFVVSRPEGQGAN